MCSINDSVETGEGTSVWWVLTAGPGADCGGVGSGARRSPPCQHKPVLRLPSWLNCGHRSLLAVPPTCTDSLGCLLGAGIIVLCTNICRQLLGVRFGWRMKWSSRLKQPSWSPLRMRLWLHFVWKQLTKKDMMFWLLKSSAFSDSTLAFLVFGCF